jgi:small subunit ribosomal protein S2
VIPGNDDALRSIRLFAAHVADTILSGRAIRESAQAEASEGGDGEDDRRGRTQRRPRSETPVASPASA